jgi:hypothetical protein
VAGVNTGEDPREGVWYSCPGSTFVILMGGKLAAGALVVDKLVSI